MKWTDFLTKKEKILLAAEYATKLKDIMSKIEDDREYSFDDYNIHDDVIYIATNGTAYLCKVMSKESFSGEIKLRHIQGGSIFFPRINRVAKI